ncbi:MAG: hypothetical protein ACKVJE_13205 [Pseudomonadales bacterium]
MSKQLDTPLSVFEKALLTLHMAMCNNCKRCNHQMRSIHSLCQKRHTESFDNDNPPT